ncbi:MAG: hypothetical protein AB7O98_14095 [Hyphomonadaceae bacterium]
MRPAGVIVSIIGHVGAVMMTLLAWETRGALPIEGTTIVPVEIVDIAAEANVRALAEDVPEEEVAPADEAPAAEPQPPAPTPTPRPTPRPPRQQEDEWDPSQAASSLRNADATGRPRNSGAPSDRNQTGAGLGTAERASLESRAASLARAALIRCWRSVEDMPEPERLVVELRIQLNRDGSLNGQPTILRPRNTTFDPQMAEAVRRATSAVRICDQRGSFGRVSEDPIVGEHYDVWRELDLTFSLAQMR